jgi:hypothetical protein
MKKGSKLAALQEVTTVWVTRGDPDWFLEKIKGEASFFLFTHPDNLWVWLDNPYETPPIVPDAE